jgi:hypothetical protein
MANYLKLPTNKRKEYSKDMKINKNKKMQNQQCKKMKKGQKEDANRLNLFGTKKHICNYNGSFNSTV